MALKIYQSGPGASVFCQTQMDAVNRGLQTVLNVNPAGLCQPCLGSILQPCQCCLQFTISGVTANGSSSSGGTDCDAFNGTFVLAIRPDLFDQGTDGILNPGYFCAWYEVPFQPEGGPFVQRHGAAWSFNQIGVPNGSFQLDGLWGALLPAGPCFGGPFEVEYQFPESGAPPFGSCGGNQNLTITIEPVPCLTCDGSGICQYQNTNPDGSINTSNLRLAYDTCFKSCDSGPCGCPPASYIQANLATFYQGNYNWNIFNPVYAPCQCAGGSSGSSSSSAATPCSGTCEWSGQLDGNGDLIWTLITDGCVESDCDCIQPLDPPEFVGDSGTVECDHAGKCGNCEWTWSGTYNRWAFAKSKCTGDCTCSAPGFFGAYDGETVVVNCT